MEHCHWPIKANYDTGNEIIYNTEVLKSNLCDYNNLYTLVRGDITIIGHQATQAAFKNCAPPTKFITKIDGTTTDDAEDLDVVILMYNLIEYTGCPPKKLYMFLKVYFLM